VARYVAANRRYPADHPPGGELGRQVSRLSCDRRHPRCHRDRCSPADGARPYRRSGEKRFATVRPNKAFFCAGAARRPSAVRHRGVNGGDVERTVRESTRDEIGQRRSGPQQTDCLRIAWLAQPGPSL